MKKLISFFILLSVMCSSSVAHSQSVEQTDPGFVLLDVLLYRPVGLAVTIIGTGLFIGMSPLTALASIPAPHDAFVKTSKILILAPADYTFVRPVGDRSFPYHASRYKHKQLATPNTVKPSKNPVIPKQRPVTPAVPDVQSPPQSYPDTGSGL
jgi:hypothetical protein